MSTPGGTTLETSFTSPPAYGSFLGLRRTTCGYKFPTKSHHLRCVPSLGLHGAAMASQLTVTSAAGSLARLASCKGFFWRTKESARSGRRTSASSRQRRPPKTSPSPPPSPPPAAAVAPQSHPPPYSQESAESCPPRPSAPQARVLR